MITLRQLRDLPGVLMLDLPRYRRALAHSGDGFRSDPRGWISLRNRMEHLVSTPNLPGVRCDWIWGSDLHAPSVLPQLGRLVMTRAFKEWPIRFANEPRVVAKRPLISFVFAHSGETRLPQLRRTIFSLFAQVDVSCEIVVVDQSPISQRGAMPLPITYRHLPRDSGNTEFHKTWAYNEGARLAKGSILVFHDGDVCAPTEYAAELVSALHDMDFAAASLQRFLFYLDPEDSKRVDVAEVLENGIKPTKVFQNWKGGSIAIRRDAFAAIGGFDEEFVGWGGEDAEFYDRCLAVGHCRSGYIPFVHLWHPPQPSKSGLQREENVAFFRSKMEIPRETRIQALRAIQCD